VPNTRRYPEDTTDDIFRALLACGYKPGQLAYRRYITNANPRFRLLRRARTLRFHLWVKGGYPVAPPRRHRSHVVKEIAPVERQQNREQEKNKTDEVLGTLNL
jgi:hypothetical protein